MIHYMSTPESSLNRYNIQATVYCFLKLKDRHYILQ